MSHEKKCLLSITAAFCLGFSLFGVAKLTSFGQIALSNSTVTNTSNTNTSNLQTTEIKQPSIIVIQSDSVSPEISPSVPAPVVGDNARFRDSLQWTFGGKPQRGWFLYESLIRRTVGTEAETNTAEFARAVYIWQQKSALAPTGTIDNETLYQMIKGWQAQRLNSSAYPSDSELLTAPVADFYDPTRDIELRRVERETYAAYKRMAAAAAKDLNLKTSASGELAPEEQYLKIVSAFRSREYQAKLRAAEPNAGRAALATNSPHFTGHALDIYVGGEPTKTDYFNRVLQVQTPVYKWLVKNAARFGFYPYYYEPWHWEYVPQNLNR